MSITDNDSMGEVEDVIELVVTPAPEHKNRLIHVYFQLLALIVAGKPACYGLLEVNSVAELFHARVHVARLGADFPEDQWLADQVEPEIARRQLHW